MTETALIFCEGAFSRTVAKTAAGLVRRSQRFRIVGVVDSVHAGRDAGQVLDGKARGIHIFPSISGALEALPEKPDWVIVGVATVGGKLPVDYRPALLEALGAGIGVISGLHQYLSEDDEFMRAAGSGGSRIWDVRKPPPLEELHPFTGRARDIPALRIPVLGTDSAIGKRTTALELVHGLNSAGVNSVLVATGQTGLLQGARYGIPLDSIKGDYMVGELENQILLAYKNERPDVILIEGQGALSHPAYVCGSRAIINASYPDAVILQHAPGRKYRHYRRDELHLPMPKIEEDMRLVKALSGAGVIAITLNDENLTPEELGAAVRDYEARFGLPCDCVLRNGTGKIVGAIRELQMP